MIEIERNSKVREYSFKGERYAEIRVTIHGELFDRLQAARLRTRMEIDKLVSEILETYLAEHADTSTLPAPKSFAPPNWP